MQGWQRTYWAVWAANFVTAVGMMSFLPFFPSHLEALGIHDRDTVATWAGVIYGAAPLAAALTSPLWGALGDRYGRRLMVLRSMLAIAVFVGAMAFARTPLELLLLRVAQGIFSGFLAPSMTLVSVVAPASEQGRVAGSLQTALAAGAIVGPALGGVASAGLGLRSVFLGVAAASLLGALLVLAFAREDPQHRRQAQGETTVRKVLSGSWGDLRDVFASRDLRGALLVVFCIQLGIGATNPILELHVRDLLGPAAHVASTSALFSVMAAVNLPAMPLWGRYGDRIGHRLAMVRCASLSAAALFLHAIAPSYGVLLFARAALGGAMAGIGPTAFGVAAGEVSVDRRGGAFGTVFSARTLAVAISAITGGYLSRFVGMRGLFAAGAVLVLLAVAGLRRPAVEEAPA